MNDVYAKVSAHSEPDSIDLPPEFVRCLDTALKKTIRDYNANVIPELDKAKTAVFTSKWSGEGYPFVESELQAKITDDFSHMTGLGCDTMIVNTGTRYGMLALRELAALKKETPFRLIRSKVRGGQVDEPSLQDAMLMSDCDCFVYADSVEQYDEIILSRVGYVSDENGLLCD